MLTQAAQVALLAEGVDRNKKLPSNFSASNMSPSSRRAWIEITRDCAKNKKHPVALLAEGVDRNGTVEWAKKLGI